MTKETVSMVTSVCPVNWEKALNAEHNGPFTGMLIARKVRKQIVMR